MFRFHRVNTEAIWENSIVVRRFQHYLGVLQGEKFARFLIAKETPVNVSDLEDLSLSDMCITYAINHLINGWQVKKWIRRVSVQIN